MNSKRFASPRCYCGYHKSQEILINTASGGFATAISEKYIHEGGIVYGVVYSKDFLGAEYKRVETIEGLQELRGSKYVDVSPKCADENVFKLVCKDITSGRKVLFFGLPCMVGALYNFLENENLEGADNYLTIDLICHGPTAPIVANQFAKEMESKYDKKIIDMKVRYKKDGNWTPPYLRVDFEDGSSKMRPFSVTDYGFAFRNLARNRCYSCNFKGENHRADMTIGDYWGVDCKDDEYNPQGVSVILTHNERAEEELLKLDNFVFSAIGYERAIKGNPYYEQLRKKEPGRDQFETLLNQKGLHYACKKMMTVKEKMRRLIPEKVIQALHKVKK